LFYHNAIKVAQCFSLGFSQAGIIEPGLKVSLPEKVIVVELLMSINPDAYFALARPFR